MLFDVQAAADISLRTASLNKLSLNSFDWSARECFFR